MFTLNCKKKELQIVTLHVHVYGNLIFENEKDIKFWKIKLKFIHKTIFSVANIKMFRKI